MCFACLFDARLQLMSLALNMEMLTIAPSYATFGNQFYLNVTSGERQQCDADLIGVVPNTCLQTQIGRFINTMGVETPFFVRLHVHSSSSTGGSASVAAEHSFSHAVDFFVFSSCVQSVILFYGNLVFLAFFLLFLGHGIFLADASKKDEPDAFRKLAAESDED